MPLVLDYEAANNNFNNIPTIEMKGFKIKTADGKTIRFKLDDVAAPVTVAAFLNVLPFTRTFFHARISGKEIWIDDAPELDIIQENSSVFAEPGEVAIAPLNPGRNKIAKCMGIFYGDGKLLDSANIFGRVLEEDMLVLEELGNKIWRGGAKDLSFEKLSDEELSGR